MRRASLIAASGSGSAANDVVSSRRDARGPDPLAEARRALSAAVAAAARGCPTRRARPRASKMRSLPLTPRVSARRAPPEARLRPMTCALRAARALAVKLEAAIAARAALR